MTFPQIFFEDSSVSRTFILLGDSFYISFQFLDYIVNSIKHDIDLIQNLY